MTRRVTTQPTGDANLDYSNRETDAAFRDRDKPGTSPMADGRFLYGVEVSSGSNITLAHGLRRKPNGWIVVRSYGAGGHLLTETESTKASITLAHGSSTGVACKVDLWVF